MDRTRGYRQKLSVGGRKYDLRVTLQLDARWRYEVLEDGRPFGEPRFVLTESDAKEFAHKTAFEAGAGLPHRCTTQCDLGWAEEM